MIIVNIRMYRILLFIFVFFQAINVFSQDEKTESIEIIDYSKSRDYEILFWVEVNKDKIKNWVAIDDLDLKKLPSKNFVRTNFYTGLTDKLTGEVMSKIIFTD